MSTDPPATEPVGDLSGRRASPARGLVISVSLMSAFAVLAWIGGLAGWRGGFALVGVPLLFGGAALTLRTLGRAQGPIWSAAVAVLGLSMTGIVGQHSPASTGQLRRELDSIGLQFFKPIAESHSGHGWCRPHCPEVRRVYRSPDTSAQAVLFDVGSRLLARHLLPDDAALRTPTLGASIHGQTAHYAVDARIDHADATLRVRTVTITLRSRRG